MTNRRCTVTTPRRFDAALLAAIMLIALSWFAVNGWSQVTDAKTVISDDAIRTAFANASDGWSVDELLLRDELRDAFVTACREQTTVESSLVERDFFERLLHLRKSGKLGVKATKRANTDSDQWLPVAEIASRTMVDRFDVNIDQWLVAPKLLAEFDTIADKIVPDCDRYEVRKAAMKLRKSRRLQPELLARVTDWKREIRTLSVDEATKNLSGMPSQPGVYIFRDKTGYLYIGQSNNLKTRLTKHLDQSDRKSLCRYLSENRPEDMTIELHIFEAGSPAEQTVVREAYESDLIRTRKPRLNVAP